MPTQPVGRAERGQFFGRSAALKGQREAFIVVRTFTSLSLIMGPPWCGQPGRLLPIKAKGSILSRYFRRMPTVSTRAPSQLPELGGAALVSYAFRRIALPR